MLARDGGSFRRPSRASPFAAFPGGYHEDRYYGVGMTSAAFAGSGGPEMDAFMAATAASIIKTNSRSFGFSGSSPNSSQRWRAAQIADGLISLSPMDFSAFSRRCRSRLLTWFLGGRRCRPRRWLTKFSFQPVHSCLAIGTIQTDPADNDRNPGDGRFVGSSDLAV